MELTILNLAHKIWHLSGALKSSLVDSFQEAFVYAPAQNMNGYVRLELFTIGCLFLLTPMYIDRNLHWLMLLPLMSIYLISAAIIGYEPLYELIRHISKRFHQHWPHHKPASISHP